MKSQMQNQEPHAEHHFADFFESLAIWGSIGWPLKCKLMGFFGHMLLSRAPPPCVVLCQGPKVNFPGYSRVTKLFCIGSPLNRSRSLTYCSWFLGGFQSIRPGNMLLHQKSVVNLHFGVKTFVVSVIGRSILH